MQTTMKISEIKIATRLRKVDEKTVKHLQHSISSNGLLHPITVNKSDNKLIAGMHRLQACKALNWDTIPVNIIDADNLNAELLEIEENLIRNDILNELEKSELHKRRKEIYEELNPNATHGGKRKKGKRNKAQSYAKNISNRTGESERTIQNRISIAEKLSPEVKDIIQNTPAVNNQSELKALSRLPQEKQMEVAKKYTENTSSSIRKTINNENKTEIDYMKLIEVNLDNPVGFASKFIEEKKGEIKINFAEQEAHELIDKIHTGLGHILEFSKELKTIHCLENTDSSQQTREEPEF